MHDTEGLMNAEQVRVRGVVQGVGFRPTVWRHARQLGLLGQVCNDAEGVLIQLWGRQAQIDAFVRLLRAQPPPLARIDTIERTPLRSAERPATFSILGSHAGETHTDIAADAASCSDCVAEIFDAQNRRFRYAFGNCTHCGPRLSIIRDVPYDRANTSMAAFPQCAACLREYRQPADRRFHAQPNACATCGPQLWLEDRAGAIIEPRCGDVIHEAAALLDAGRILAIKGIGGIHLACDATNEAAVSRLRSRKRRYHKAFALMARDIGMLRRHVRLSEAEADLLRHRAAPIVILDACGEALAASVAPGQNQLGFMLPYSPLHHLLMAEMPRPLVLTSGNRSEEPQCITNEQAREGLREIADVLLLHDREIVNRLDDSVVRMVDGRVQTLRRARGYVPQALTLPAGFSTARSLLAMGAELKNTFCLVKDGKAVVSQHMGDLEDAATLRDYLGSLRLYRQLFDLQPECIVVDCHPDYLSSRHGRDQAQRQDLPLMEVQHHHAHIAACLLEQGMARDCPPVLGIALDGLGMGDDGTLWGGEFLKVDYASCQRLACFEPVALPGGAQAIYQPWRNTLAQLQHYGKGPQPFFADKPEAMLRQMLQRGVNCPLASSAGRLFDAVAAAMGICVDRASYEGQAAVELEALAAPCMDGQQAAAYTHSLNPLAGRLQLGWAPLWDALLADLDAGISRGEMAARFHWGMIRAVCAMALRLCAAHDLQTLVLSGGVFQNRLLLQGCTHYLRAEGLQVCYPQAYPANDGGIALGQAAVALARLADGGADSRV
jgi:hydrogenase maturation protein HypF